MSIKENFKNKIGKIKLKLTGKKNNKKVVNKTINYNMVNYIPANYYDSFDILDFLIYYPLMEDLIYGERYATSDEINNINNYINNIVIDSEDVTLEETQSVDNYIDNIPEPTEVNYYGTESIEEPFYVSTVINEPILTESMKESLMFIKEGDESLYDVINRVSESYKEENPKTITVDTIADSTFSSNDDYSSTKSDSSYTPYEDPYQNTSSYNSYGSDNSYSSPSSSYDSSPSSSYDYSSSNSYDSCSSYDSGSSDFGSSEW